MKSRACTCLQTLRCPPSAPARPPLPLATRASTGHQPACAPWHLSLRGSERGRKLQKQSVPRTTPCPSGASWMGGFAQRRAEVGTHPSPKGQQPHHGDTACRDTACSEKTGGLEQSLRSTGRAWHSPKWNDPQGPQGGAGGSFSIPVQTLRFGSPGLDHRPRWGPWSSLTPDRAAPLLGAEHPQGAGLSS